MKKFNVTNRVSAQAKSEIERIISTNEKYSKAYFFHPDSTADGRRRSEKKFALNNPDVAFINGEETIEVSMSYEESCNNVYYKLYVISKKGDDEKVKNITAIKKLLK